jgi:hypothetical protein
MTKNEITKPPTRKLTKKQLKQLASFTDPGTVLSSLSEAGWTIEEAIKHLVTIAKGEDKSAKTSTQLAAIRYLNQLIVDAMERSGLMLMASAKITGKGGEELRLSGHVVQSILGGQKEQTTPQELLKQKDKKDDSEKESQEEDIPKTKTEEAGEAGLHSSKFPTGAGVEGGHFDGISKASPDQARSGGASGDFL